MVLLYTLAATQRLRDMGWAAGYALILALAPFPLLNYGRNNGYEVVELFAQVVSLVGFIVMIVTPGRSVPRPGEPPPAENGTVA
jgi:uncharacterized membrane protein YhaH (DUF805 family)